MKLPPLPLYTALPRAYNLTNRVLRGGVRSAAFYSPPVVMPP